MSPYCASCGASIQPGDAFCTSCGIACRDIVSDISKEKIDHSQYHQHPPPDQDPPKLNSQYPCPQCGSQIHVDSGTHITRCEFCSSFILLDRSGILFTYALPFVIDDKKGREIFKRWTAGPHMAIGLENEASITNWKQLFFPIYLFKLIKDRKEILVIRSARNTLIPGIEDLTIPPGNYQTVDSSFAKGSIYREPVDVRPTDLTHDLPGKPKEQLLIYLPIYLVTYEFRGTPYRAIIEGSSGGVYASIYPSTSSFPYKLVTVCGFGITFLGAFLGLVVNLIFWLLIPAGFFISYNLGLRLAR